MTNETDLIKAAEEALEIAKGNKPAARLHHSGHTYVPKAELEAAQARIAELEGECSRRAALIPIAYGEGIVDAFARGATVENSSEKFETSDAKAALANPEIHRSEWPDNYDNAMARAALEGKA